MATLLPLVLSAYLDALGEAVAFPPHADAEQCAFCGVQSGRWQRFIRSSTDRRRLVAACPLCFLCCHLERPSIDKEAALVWLPEMSQAALNVMMRAIHMGLRALSEDLGDGDEERCSNTPERARLDRARTALSERRRDAVARIGTECPSELAAALYRLSPAGYANRAKLLAGVRLLPRGHFYDRGANIYPEIVDFWRGIAGPHASPTPGGLAPVVPS